MPDVITHAALSEVTDEALLRRIAQRERQALEQLYDRHSARVCGMARLVQPDPTRAEEIILETFWYVWKHADKLRTGAPNIEILLTTIVAWVAAHPGNAPPAQNLASSPRSPLQKSDEPKKHRLHFSQR